MLDKALANLVLYMDLEAEFRDHCVFRAQILQAKTGLAPVADEACAGGAGRRLTRPRTRTPSI
jgi:hypothetical protein